MITHGGAFENFPYTNFHELNLDWLLNKVKEYIEKFLALETDFKELQNNFDELKAWVEQYIDEELRDAVNAKLDEWLEDGTLEDLVEGKVYQELLHLVPDQEEVEEYQENVLKTLVNWLERNHGADYFAENQAITETIPITIKYATGQGYMGQYGGYKFITDDMFEADGINCHVCYMDCTTFVSLIQKNIPWNTSPYYEMMVNNDQVAAYKAGLLAYRDPKGVKPYLTDVYGDITTYQEAFLLDISGNHPVRLSEKTRIPATNDGEETLTLNEININNLKTGDIIWVGDNSVSLKNVDREKQYKCIHHDAVFVKSLDELNAFTHNVVFKLSDSAGGRHPEYGYVIHCTNESETYKNGIRIATLMDFMDNVPAYRIYETTGLPNYPNRNAIRGVYSTSGTISDSGSDSRFTFYADNSLRAGKKEYLRHRIRAGEYNEDLFDLTATIDSSVGASEWNSIGSRGWRLQPTFIDTENLVEEYDLNAYTYNGHYTNPRAFTDEEIEAGWTRRWINFPWNTTNGVGVFELYVSAFKHANDNPLTIDGQQTTDKRNGIQIMMRMDRPVFWERNTNDNGEFNSWLPGIRRSIVKRVEATTVPANSYVDVTKTFKELLGIQDETTVVKMSATPAAVFARLRGTSSLTIEEFFNVGIGINSYNMSQVVVRLYNNTNTERSLSWEVMIVEEISN